MQLELYCEECSAISDTGIGDSSRQEPQRFVRRDRHLRDPKLPHRSRRTMFRQARSGSCARNVIYPFNQSFRNRFRIQRNDVPR